MRSFVAIPVPETVAAALAPVQAALPFGRLVEAENLHLTLAFLGEQPEPLASRLAQRVATMRVAPGRWQLDSWGYFSRPGIVWIGSDHPDASLHALQAALWSELEALGIAGRPKTFVPHVTLLRDAAQPPGDELPAPALSWRYRRLALVRSTVSRDGSCYRVLARSALPDGSSA